MIATGPRTPLSAENRQGFQSVLALSATVWEVGGPRSIGRSRILCDPGTIMRDVATIETELMEISAIADDLVKLERVIAWCASHPDEVPFALHQLMNQGEKQPAQSARPEPGPEPD